MKTFMLLMLLLFPFNTVALNTSKHKPNKLSKSFSKEERPSNIIIEEKKILRWQENGKPHILINGVIHILKPAYRPRNRVKRSYSCPLLLKHRKKHKSLDYFRIDIWRFKWVFYVIGITTSIFAYKFYWK